jgi:hypothetical protein
MFPAFPRNLEALQEDKSASIAVLELMHSPKHDRRITSQAHAYVQTQQNITKQLQDMAAILGRDLRHVDAERSCERCFKKRKAWGSLLARLLCRRFQLRHAQALGGSCIPGPPAPVHESNVLWTHSFASLLLALIILLIDGYRRTCQNSTPCNISRRFLSPAGWAE